MTKLNGLMVEGAAEAAIIDILLEKDLLIFTEDDLVTSSNGECRQDRLSDDSFIKDFLAHDLGKIDFSMHVVLDNPNRSCKVLQNSKQISDITYYVTREEIEAVHLYANSKWPAEYEKYLKKVKGKESKPSSFFKNECNIKNPRLSS